MSLFDTEKALQVALNSVPSIPAIAWPNTKYTPIVGTPFVRPTILPAKAEVYTLNNENKHSGIYQVDIYVPPHKGIKVMYAIADSIKTYYQSNKALSSGSQKVFIMAVDVGKSEEQDAWYSTFVEINYLSYN